MLNLNEKFSQVLRESNLEDTPAGKFAAELKQIVLKHFPHSFAYARFDVGLTPSIFVTFALGKDKTEWINTYLENDPAKHKFSIFGMTKEGFTTDKMTMDCIMGGSIQVLPAAGSHYAYDSVKVGWRKKTGDDAALKKHFDAYMVKLKKLIKDNADRFDMHDLKYSLSDKVK